MHTSAEDAMPEVVVYAIEGRSVDQRRGLVKDITNAVTKNYGVPADTVGKARQGQGRRPVQ